MTIEQIKIGHDNFTYIIHCKNTKNAAIVDPGYEPKKILKFISQNNLNLKFIIATHYHSDHTSGIKEIKNKIPSALVISSKIDGTNLVVKPDMTVKDKEKLKVGNINLTFLITPGHTPGGIIIIVDNEAIITGDTLFIGDCGRTDLLGGSLLDMFNSLNEIKKLPDNLIVFPGHDYGDKPFDALGNQKRTNKVLLALSLEEFSKIE